MTDVMRHRGPNDRGIYLVPGIALGVRRLSIVDVEGGHQPVSSPDGRIWAVQNGELYNHQELRARLRASGHQFRSSCDTEVIPPLYDAFGPAFPNELRGMFAIAVWDERSRRAILVRDRLGVKPLYYTQQEGLLVFGSELKSILASGLIAPAIDYEAIEAYLSFGFVPGPRTFIAGVRKLMPGNRLIVDASSVRSEQYWSYPQPKPNRQIPVEEWPDRLLTALRESVAMRLMSDVPLGAMLSGGLDSSLIVAIMAEQMAEPVKTFSVGFAGASPNELEDARNVANLLGTDHHEIELSLNTDLDIAELIWYLDEPVADLSSFGFFALSELASKHVTVALSGQGADELLGGYSRHRAAAAIRYWNGLPGPLRRGLARVAPNRLRLSRLETLASADPLRRMALVKSNLTQSAQSRLFKGSLTYSGNKASLQAITSRVNHGRADPLGELLSLDAQLGLVERYVALL